MARSNQDSDKRSSKASRLEMFLGESCQLDLENLTVEDVLNVFDFRSFDRYFDRAKILARLEEKAQQFEEEILGKVFCSHCKSSNVKKIVDNNVCFEKCYKCLDCERKFKPSSFVKSHSPNWVLASMLSGVFQGKTPREIVQSLIVEASNRHLDFGCQGMIPADKTLYDLIDKCAKKFQKFNDFMFLLLGGLSCNKLFVDDLFSRRRMKRRKQPDSGIGRKKKKKRRKGKRFYYSILAMDADFRLIICLHVTSSRDKSAFRVAFAETEARLKHLPEVVMGDKLRAMEKAAEAYFPKNEVEHVFRKRKPWRKGELSKIERRIRDARKTLKKRRKSGSKRVLQNYATVCMIGQNYLEPMEKALGGRTPAQAVGIPYPLYRSDWRKFIVWVDWVLNHIPEILRSGLKLSLASNLVPYTESSGELFKERMRRRRKTKKNPTT